MLYIVRLVEAVTGDDRAPLRGGVADCARGAIGQGDHLVAGRWKDAGNEGKRLLATQANHRAFRQTHFVGDLFGVVIGRIHDEGYAATVRRPPPVDRLMRRVGVGQYPLSEKLPRPLGEGREEVKRAFPLRPVGAALRRARARLENGRPPWCLR